mgnify:CR=1 FL=1
MGAALALLLAIGCVALFVYGGTAGEPGRQETEASDANDWIYEHPEDAVNTEEAKNLVKMELVAPSIADDPILRRITFGWMNVSTDAIDWYAPIVNGNVSYDAGLELMALAILQMCDGDTELAKTAFESGFTNAKHGARKVIPNKSGSGAIKSSAKTEGSFSVDGTEYQVHTGIWYKGSKIDHFYTICISTKRR